MNKFEKSQILILLSLTALLMLTPLLSPSLRPAYLYFIFNLLIIALGAEAGVLSTVFKPNSDEKNQPPSSTSKQAPTADSATDIESSRKQMVVEKSMSEKIHGNVKMEILNKCPSSSSIFFIGDEEAEAEERAEGEVLEEEVGGGVLNSQELFTQAEKFIANFYKQLKMQKEESWKNIHGFYQKGF